MPPLLTVPNLPFALSFTALLARVCKVLNARSRLCLSQVLISWCLMTVCATFP